MGGKKIQRIYDALVEGSERGLTGQALYRHVVSEVPKATSKKVVKASLFALSDPDLVNKELLKVIYDLAISHRVDSMSADNVDKREPAPEVKKAKRAKKEQDKVDSPAATFPQN